MTLKGKVDPSWIQNARSEWREKRKRSFKRSFKVEQVAPAWLFEEPTATTTKAADHVGLPWAVDEKNEKTVSKLDGYLAELKKRTADAGSRTLLIMCDGEGRVGAPMCVPIGRVSTLR